MDNREATREALLAEVTRLRQRVQELDPANGNAVGTLDTESAGDGGATDSDNLGRTFSQDQIITILESMPSAVVIINAADGRFAYINKRAQKLYGTDQIGTDLDEHLPLVQAMKPDGTLYATEDLPASRSIREGITIHNEEMAFRQPSGRELAVLVSSTPLRNQAGRIIAAVVSFQDITEFRQSMRTVSFQAHLLDCVQDAIIATDESFHNTYLNKAAETLFGWTAAEALGKTTFELMDPIVQEPSMEEAIEKLWENDAYVGEVIYHHKDGTPIIVENHARLIRDEQGNVRETVTSARDIRARKQTELALLESERRYRELVRHAPTGIYEIDISRHRFLSVNDCMTMLTGYTREELLAMDPMDLLDDASYQVYLRRLRQWESGKTPDPNVDYTWVVKDGRSVHVALNTTFGFDSDGRPKAMTVIAHDVTERKQLEMTLKRQAEELLIANRNKNLFLNMLSHELRNPLAAIIASLDLLTHLKPDEDRAERALRVLRRQAGHLSHLVDDLLDVTRITTNKIRLEKEPTDIVSLVQRITADLLPQFDAKGVALTVDSAIGQSLVVMVDPTRIIQAIGNLLHNALKFTPGGGTVTLAVSREDWPTDEDESASVSTASLLARPDELAGLTGLTGLAGDRAVSAVSESDEVDEAGAAGAVCGMDEAGGTAGAKPLNRQAVRITIQDNGAGIAPDILPFIFEPFSQAEQPLARTHGGLGLGLAIVKGMIELHGGRVEAASEGIGRGARFTILLPIESGE